MDFPAADASVNFLCFFLFHLLLLAPQHHTSLLFWSLQSSPIKGWLLDRKQTKHNQIPKLHKPIITSKSLATRPIDINHVPPTIQNNINNIFINFNNKNKGASYSNCSFWQESMHILGGGPNSYVTFQSSSSFTSYKQSLSLFFFLRPLALTISTQSCIFPFSFIFFKTLFGLTKSFLNFGWPLFNKIMFWVVNQFF